MIAIPSSRNPIPPSFIGKCLCLKKIKRDSVKEVQKKKKKKKDGVGIGSTGP